MRIALFSDLHLEFNKDVQLVADDADVIVLAGDIGKVDDALSLAQTLGQRHQVPVLYVPGNHEYYGQDLDALNKRLRDWRDEQGWVTPLLERSILIQGVRFLGTPLWTNFQLRGVEAGNLAREMATKLLPDFKLIRRGEAAFSTKDAEKLYEQAHAFLEEELSHRSEPCVVITHFAPHADCCAPQFLQSPLTPYFINDCTALIERHQPPLWLFGHTHYSVDYRVGSTRILANQHGYPHEVGKVSGFDSGKRIELAI